MGIRYFNKLLMAFLIAGGVLWVAVLNTTSLTVFVAPGRSFTAPAGVVLLFACALGIIVTAIVAAMFAFRAHLRERSLQYSARIRTKLLESLLEARSYTESQEFGKARDLWERLLRKKGDEFVEIIASLELSRVLEKMGEPLQALKCIDAIRTTYPNRSEILFRAAELSVALGNKTAALDNLALVLYHHPNRRAATLARDLSEELGRYEDALEYSRHLEKLGAEEMKSPFRMRLAYHSLEASSGEKRKRALRELLKAYPACSLALRELSSIEEQEGRYPDAADLMVKYARIEKTSSAWKLASELWLRGGKPERAVAAMRSALDDLSNSERLRAFILLVRLQLELNLTDDAIRVIEEQNDFLSTIPHTDSYLFLELQALRILSLARAGRFEEANRAWDDERKLHLTFTAVQPPRIGEGPPSPTLSTP